MSELQRIKDVEKAISTNSSTSVVSEILGRIAAIESVRAGYDYTQFPSGVNAVVDGEDALAGTLSTGISLLDPDTETLHITGNIGIGKELRIVSRKTQTIAVSFADAIINGVAVPTKIGIDDHIILVPNEEMILKKMEASRFESLLGGQSPNENAGVVGTTTPTETTEGPIIGLPTEPIAPNTPLNLQIVPPAGFAGPNTFELYRTSPNRSASPLSTTDTYSPTFVRGPQTLGFEWIISGPGVGSGVPSASLMERILKRRQPGTNHAALNGYGRFATGGRILEYVDNMSQLKDAARTEGLLVALSPNFGRYSIEGSSIEVHANTTITGSEAPEHEIYNPGGAWGIRVLGGNTIMHCLNLTCDPNADASGVSYRDGLHHWMDQVSFTGYNHDDAMNIGNSTSSLSADQISITNCYWDDAAFGGCVINWFDSDLDKDNLGLITVAYNYFQGDQRNFKNDGAARFHQYNCLVNNVRVGTDTYNDNGPNPQDIPNTQNKPAIGQRSTTWYEGNRGTNSDGGNRPLIRTRSDEDPSESVIFHRDNSHDGSYTISSSDSALIERGQPGYEEPNFPYSYDLLAEDEIEAYIAANAGCRFDLSYEPVGGGSAAITHTEPFVIEITS